MQMKPLILAATTAAFALPASAADVVIGVPNWASVSATAHVLKVVIEDNLGLEVELQNGTNPIVFEAMDKGSMHVHPEVWMPNQQNLHNTYVKDKGTVVMNGNPVQAEQGMCVPTAIAEEYGITSIDDLTDPDKMARSSTATATASRRSGSAPRAGPRPIVEKIRAKSYGYDQTMEMTEFDETLAYANLATAIKAKRALGRLLLQPALHLRAA